MISHDAKFVITLCLSLLAIVMFIVLKGRERKLAMFGMLLSTLGDIFMIDMFKLGDVSTYPGAAFFMAAHVLYAIGFIKASKFKGYAYKNAGFKIGLAFVIVGAVVLGILAFTIPEVPETVMFFLILIYVAVIGFNLVSQFSYAASEGGSRVMLIVAMTLFFVSDFVIFLNMLAITPAHNDLVWLTYIPAQLLIILFNSDLKREK